MNEKKLHKIIDNIDYYLIFRKGHWMHNCCESETKDKLEIKFVSDSIKIDKQASEMIKITVIKECKPAHSILSPSGTTVGKNKSVKDTVFPHIKNKYILKLDISRFFDSIKYDAVKKILSKASIPLWFIEEFYFKDGILRRGLHASSFIAEIIGVKIDNMVGKVLHEKDCIDITYTRYCDDILLSSDDKNELSLIEVAIANGLSKLGLSLNESKSKLVHMHTASILGLHIHNGEIVISKHFKKKTRMRIYYASMMYDKCDMSDESSVDTTLKAVGSAIGSVQHILNHSISKNTVVKYTYMRRCLYSKLSELERAREEILEDDNPILLEEL